MEHYTCRRIPYRNSLGNSLLEQYVTAFFIEIYAFLRRKLPKIEIYHQIQENGEEQISTFLVWTSYVKE